MRKLIDYFKKPIPAFAFGTTALLATIKALGTTGISWSAVFAPLVALGIMYALLGITVLAAIVVQMVRIKNIAKARKDEK